MLKHGKIREDTSWKSANSHWRVTNNKTSIEVNRQVLQTFIQISYYSDLLHMKAFLSCHFTLRFFLCIPGYLIWIHGINYIHFCSSYHSESVVTKAKASKVNSRIHLKVFFQYGVVHRGDSRLLGHLFAGVLHLLERKFMSCSHCHELGQQASCDCTRTNSQ